MTLFVTEHASVYGGVLSRPVAAYTVSSSTTRLPQAGTKYIRVIADAGSYLNLLGSTVALTSTNSMRLAANVPELFGVSTALLTQGAST